MPDLLTVPDIAKKLGMTEGAVRTSLSRDDGGVPPPIRLGPRKIRWKEEDVDKWINEKNEE